MKKYSFFIPQTSSGAVEAKVVCYYRRRDITASLVQLADKYQSKVFFISVVPLFAYFIKICCTIILCRDLISKLL